MNRRSVGIVGLGYWGPNLLRNFGAIDEWEMRWACDLKEENLAKARAHNPSVKTTSSYDDLLKDPTLDLIAVATPTKSHFDLAKKALEAGKHVFVEKPLASTSAQGEELIALAKKQGKLLFVDHTFAFAGAVKKMKELMQAGELGELYYFDSTRINLGLIQPDVNVLWDLAIHDLAMLGQLKDLRDIESVFAHGSNYHGNHREIGHLHLSWKDGFDAHIHVSWLSPVKIRQTIVGGTKKMVLFDDIHPSEKLKIYDTGIQKERLGEMKPADPLFPVYRSGDVLIPKIDTTETLRVELLHVLACINGKEAPLSGGAEGLTVLRILEAADRSLEAHSPVDL